MLSYSAHGCTGFSVTDNWFPQASFKTAHDYPCLPLVVNCTFAWERLHRSKRWCRGHRSGERWLKAIGKLEIEWTGFWRNGWPGSQGNLCPGSRGGGSDSRQSISRMFPFLNWKSPFHMVLLISNQTRVFGPLRETSCSKAGEGYQCSERGNSGDGVKNFGPP